MEASAECVAPGGVLPGVALRDPAGREAGADFRTVGGSRCFPQYFLPSLLGFARRPMESGQEPRPASNRPRKQFRGAVAQLGERLICTQEATGSIPVSSTSFGPNRGPVAQVARAHA